MNVVESIRDPNVISNSILSSSEISNRLLQIETDVKAKKRKTAEVKSTDTATDLAHYFEAFETNIKEFINGRIDAISRANKNQCATKISKEKFDKSQVMGRIS